MLKDFTRPAVTYTYDCGNGILADFTFAISGFTHTHEYSSAVTPPDCTKLGYTTYICIYCGESYRDNYTSELGHHYEESVVPAEVGKNGYKLQVCSRCGTSIGRETIYPAKTVTLSTSTYVYNGQQKKPAVTVKDSKGNRIASKYYTVAYANNIKAGKATVTVKLKGNYSGSLTKTFTIRPPASKVTKLRAQSKGFEVYWQKQPRQVSGYQIAYSTSSKFTSGTTATQKISKIGTTYKSISKLKKKKKYYVRIRTYVKVSVNGKQTTVYSAWSAAKSVTTKK